MQGIKYRWDWEEDVPLIAKQRVTMLFVCLCRSCMLLVYDERPVERIKYGWVQE